MSFRGRTIQGFDKTPPHHSALSRREACKGLGLLGAALLLEACGSFPTLGIQAPRGLTVRNPEPLTSEQFHARAGTVEEARVKATLGNEAIDEFIEDFLLLSPRIQAATEAGLIGSVFYNPSPASIATAVRFQLAREQWEPELLHNDLGKMAALQYKRLGPRSFAAIFPNTASLVGENIHKDRSILQLVVHGNLPPEAIVRTNQDLESLIGRQLTLAHQIVHGIRWGKGNAPLRSAHIWDDDRHIPERTVSLALVKTLVRLEVAGVEVRAITPADPHEEPSGWQQVSAAYRNFAVGQLIEAEQAVAQHAPRNTFEQTIRTHVLAEYQPYLVQVRQRLEWGSACHEAYAGQKQESRADILAQPVFIPYEGMSKRL